MDSGPTMEAIAILGMGMRLPGGVYKDSQYWDLLHQGKSGWCRVPQDRYNIDAWYGPGKPFQVGTKYGYFLKDVNLAHIDSAFWSMSKQEARLMDPRQRLLLEVVHEAFESSGTTGWRGKETGVYVGVMGDDWTQMKALDSLDVDPVRADVFGDYIIANRVSYEFDLKGPSIVVRTACSSSLTALHMACQDLRSHVCDSAIVGGANLILSHTDTVAMTEQGVLSIDGKCKSFDANADGYGRGDAVSAIYIKRLTDALRDGDPIRAVIKATCVSGDGRSNGMTMPDPISHERLIRRTYRLAGINDVSQTAMVECHGTGTHVGDPLEVKAVANVWGEEGIYIGSVKPNIGHGEGASGLSSIMKMVLALENATIPPNINFESPNPMIPWGSAKLRVPVKPMPWPSDRLERVSVSSFGIGGSNAHVILESASQHGVRSVVQRKTPDATTSPHLLVFSAKHTASLMRSVVNIESYITRCPNNLSDIAHSLIKGREVYPYRTFAVANYGSTLNIAPATKPANNSTLKTIWVFTGQGAQWAQMGIELLERHALVKQRIDELDNVLASLPNPPPWTIRGEISKPKETSRLYEAEFSQPCLAAIQISLVDLLKSWGVEADAVVGHSSGETAAAYASGAITAEEAMVIAYHRGQITPQLKASHNGSMCAVGLGRSEVEPYLLPGVIVGCENSPSSVTLSGEASVLPKVMAAIQSSFPGAFVRALRVECGYHSAHMNTVAPDYASRLAYLPKGRKPLIPFYSSVTGEPTEDLSSSYWIRNLISPVLFSPAVRRLLEDFKSPIFIELGPHSALAGPIRQILQESRLNAQYVPTIVRNNDSLTSILYTAGQLWLYGVDIRLSSVNGPGNFLPDLPTYSWHYEHEYWAENRISRQQRLRQFGHHELLGSRASEASDATPMWRSVLRLEDIPWLKDHVVLGEIVFPATAFVAMIGEATRQLTESTSYTLENVTFAAPLPMANESIELITTLKKLNSKLDTVQYNFSISSLNEGVWNEHAWGLCGAASEAPSNPSDSTLIRLPRKVPISPFYNLWKKYGLEYGPQFRGLHDVRSDTTKSYASGIVDDERPANCTSFYTIHPAALDSSLQLCMIASSQGLQRKFDGLEIPVSLKQITVRGVCGPLELQAETDYTQGHIKNGKIHGYSNGTACLIIEGLGVTSLKEKSFEDEDPHAAAILEWKPDISFLTSDSLLRGISNNLSQTIQLLGHKYPSMQILELGEEAISSESSTLKALLSDHGERHYRTYTFAEPKDIFSTTNSLFHAESDAGTFILSNSTLFEAQKFPQAYFDLIVAPTAMRERALDEAILRAIGKLISPSGRLLLYQAESSAIINPNISDSSCTYASRCGSLLSKDEIKRKLKLAGFDSFRMETLGDAKCPTVSLVSPERIKSQININVVCRDLNHPLVVGLSAYLEDLGVETSKYLIGQILPHGRISLFLLDLESPFLFDMLQEEFSQLKTTFKSLDDTGALWLTGASQINCIDPRYSLTLGFTRTIRHELGIDLVTLELDTFSESSWNSVFDVLETFNNRLPSPSPVLESEYVLSQGLIHINRFRRLHISKLVAKVGSCGPSSHEASTSQHIPTDDSFDPPNNESVQDNRDKADHGRSWILKAKLSMHIRSEFKANRTYVLIGGLGGIGMACARLLVERGVRYLLFFSRSAEQFLKSNPEYREELESMGCHIQVVSGHVEDEIHVKTALSSATHPIGGVIHAAMVLQDNDMVDMTFDQWQSAVLPKVAGAWNIHNSLNDQPESVDFFLLLSSLSGLGGQVGQANYAAANSFLDAFVQYRQRNGLACSVLDIGLVEDIGILARETHRLRAFDAAVTHSLCEKDVLDAVEFIINPRCGSLLHMRTGRDCYLQTPWQIALGIKFNVSSSPIRINSKGWRNDARVQAFWNEVPEAMDSFQASDTGSLKQFLQRCLSDSGYAQSDEAVIRLAREIGVALGGLMMQTEEDVDIDGALEMIGLDSLVSVELRNWIRRNIGVVLSVTEILSATSIMGIADMARRKLQERA